MTKRIALVTGGNRGIGRAIARGLARAGMRVALTSRSLDRAEAACNELSDDGELEPHELDVTLAGSIDRLVASIGGTHGGLDVLVSNAGVALDGFDARVARETVAANYTGPLRVHRALEERLRPGARVVMVSSGVGDRSRLSSELRRRLDDERLTVEQLSAWMTEFVEDVAAGRHAAKGWPGSAYCVSKIGLNRLTELLAGELADDERGILVNAACPGWVRTDMGGQSAPRSPEEGADTPLWLAQLPAGGPTGGFFRDRAPSSW